MFKFIHVTINIIYPYSIVTPVKRKTISFNIKKDISAYNNLRHLVAIYCNRNILEVERY